MDDVSKCCHKPPEFLSWRFVQYSNMAGEELPLSTMSATPGDDNDERRSGSFDDHDGFQGKPKASFFVDAYENDSWWEKSFIADWLVGVVLLVLGSIVQRFPPAERDLNPNDIDISHPMHDSSVPGAVLWFLAAVFPIGVFVLYNFFDTLKKYFFNRERIGRGKLLGMGMHDIHSGILGLLNSLALTKLITDIFKISVGRMRPDFLERCQLGILQHCTGNEFLIAEGRKSFPSGHSSIAFAGMTFLTLYLASKLASLSWDAAPTRYRLPKFVITIVPLVVAGLVAASRVRDNRHHPTDVITGGLLGLFVAWACFRIYYRSPFGGDALAMRFPKWIKDDNWRQRIEGDETAVLFGP